MNIVGLGGLTLSTVVHACVTSTPPKLSYGPLVFTGDWSRPTMDTETRGRSSPSDRTASNSAQSALHIQGLPTLDWKYHFRSTNTKLGETKGPTAYLLEKVLDKWTRSAQTLLSKDRLYYMLMLILCHAKFTSSKIHWITN